MGIAPSEVYFVFDAGALARVYATDISTRTLRTIRQSHPSRIVAPDLAAIEVTSAWLHFVRQAPQDPRSINWATYQALSDAFAGDVLSGEVVLVNMEPLLPRVRAVIEDLGALKEAGAPYPVIHAHDAYYLTLAERMSQSQRTVLVTNDRALWINAHVMGVEAFHGSTCDRGELRLDVGMPGVYFPHGRPSCQPCRHTTCPSGFSIDESQWSLGTGAPETEAEIKNRSSL